MKNKQPLVVGTIAFDRIFFVSPSIRREAETCCNTESPNLNFVVNNSTIMNGGTAGNISYSLGILGKKPVLFSAVGGDFYGNGYGSFLESKGVLLAVDCYDSEESACCYQINDDEGGQMTIWISNAYDHIDETGLNDSVKDVIDSIAIASFSTGNPVGTINQMKELKALNPDIISIFDPGARITSYSPAQFEEGLVASDILALNESEILKAKAMGFSVKKMLSEYVNHVIITLGSNGSEIRSRNGDNYHISAFKPAKIMETTGAGDAYRAGLIAGILEKEGIQEAARIGSVVASYCIEGIGAQSHEITREDVENRKEKVSIKEINDLD
ncbi:MAG: PfkB family carbohydrate kinase [Candidatus Hodarchaeales archaeon]